MPIINCPLNIKWRKTSQWSLLFLWMVCFLTRIIIELSNNRHSSCNTYLHTVSQFLIILNYMFLSTYTYVRYNVPIISTYHMMKLLRNDDGVYFLDRSHTQGKEIIHHTKSNPVPANLVETSTSFVRYQERWVVVKKANRDSWHYIHSIYLVGDDL